MEENMQELKNIAEPIIKFLQRNYNPHTAVIIKEDCIKVVSDEMNIPID